MAGRRKKSTPKIVPKVKEMDEYTMIEHQLQDGNVNGEIVISIKEEHEFQENSTEEDIYIPEVSIKMEFPSFEPVRGDSSSPHLVVTNFEGSSDTENEQHLELNLPHREPLSAIAKCKETPSTAEVNVVNRTRSRNRAQQNSAKLEVSNPVESPQKKTPCQRETKMEKTSPRPIEVAKPLTCDQCGLSFSLMMELIRHRKFHSDDNMFSCDQCSYRSQRIDYLLRHMRIHSGKRPVKCEYCPYTARFSSTMRVHELIHIGTKPYSCALCDYRTNEKNKLVPHLRRHYGWKPFRCKKCNRRFVVKAELRAHMSVHAKKKSNPGMNSMQHWKSASASEMKEHNEKLEKAVQAVKEGMPFKVAAREHCVTVSTLFYRLYPRHLYPPGKKSIKIAPNGIKKGDGKRKFPCSVCEYSATASATLKKHMRTHTGERPFPCNQCDYRAARSTTLRVHMIQHSGERKQKSRNQSSVARERRHPCNLCDYRAARSTTLRLHMKRHSMKGKKAQPDPAFMDAVSKDSDVKISRVTFVGESDIMAAAAKLPKARVVLHNVLNKHPIRTKKTQPVNGAIPSNSPLGNLTVIKEERIEDLRPDVKSSPLPSSSLPKAVSNDWPYMCTACNFKASTGFELREHQQLHLGLPCSLCNFRSFEIDDLKQHVLSVHII